MKKEESLGSKSKVIKKWFPVKARLILIFGFVIVIASTLQIFIAERISRNAVTEKVETHLINKAKDTSEIVENKVNSLLRFLEGLSYMPLLTDKSVPFEEKAERLKLQVRTHKNILLISTTDAKGNLYTSGLKTIDVSKQSWFPVVMSGKPSVSEPFVSAINGNLVIFISVPVYKGKDNVIGSIGVTLRGSWLSDQIKDTVVGKTGYCYILNKKGTIIAYKDNRLIEKMENSIELSKTDESIKPLAKFNENAIKSDKSSVNFYSYKGVKKIGSHAKMKNYDWTIIVSAPYGEFMGTVDYLRFTMIIIGVTIGLITLTIVYIVAHNLVKPIKKATKLMEKVTNGMLSSVDSVSVTSNDEIGRLIELINTLTYQLKMLVKMNAQVADGDLTSELVAVSDEDEVASATSRMIKKIRHAVSEVGKSIHQVNEGARQISDSSQNLSHGASQQAASLEEMSASLNELSSQIQERLKGTIEVSKITEEARISAVGGSKQMKELVVAMDEIDQSANDIKNIVGIIDDIAFQTNLLALNADIEAARVGKYGKGFAVVANSVRTLATKSQASVKDTKTIVEKTITNINKGVDLVNRTYEHLEKIAKGSIQVSEISKQSVITSKEQARGVEQISNGVSSIEEVVQNNSASAEENAASSKELALQSERLTELIAYFKTERNELHDHNETLALKEADI